MDLHAALKQVGHVLQVLLLTDPAVQAGPEALELVVPKRIRPGLVQELRQVANECLTLAFYHQVQLRRVHAH